MKMKKHIIILFALLISIGYSCEDKHMRTFVANSPIYMSYDELAESVNQVDPKALENTGKLYFKDNYIFIIEELEGLHIINNSDPANPINQTFIEIPGAIDIAINGTHLYIDSYVDLVTLDISDLDAITEISRNKDVFPYIIPPYDINYPLAKIESEKGVIVGWKIKTVQEEIESYYYQVYKGFDFANSVGSYESSNSSGINTNGFGIGGSMARFGLYEEVLYIIDDLKLNIFSLNNPDKPVFYNEFYAGWNIETMYLLGDKMFLGTQSGMRIYDISNALSPMYISQFWHVTSCDPVVVKNNLAYITLRGGTACWNDVNELDVVSLDDIENPELLKRYSMTNPHGLGIDGETLFLCDGDAGLKIYDISDPLAIDDNQIATFANINAFDVIPINGVLFMIGEDGFYQYDYSDLQNIQFLSKIEIAE